MRIGFAQQQNKRKLQTGYKQQYITLQKMDCFKTKEKYQFIPEKWEQGIGQICFSCKTRLEAQDCISLCKCYLFCHEQCFLREWSPYIKQCQQIRCIRCGEQVTMKLAFIRKWECNKKPAFIISSVIAICIIIAMFILTAVGLYRPIFADGVGYAIFAILLVLLIIAFVFGLWKKYINLDEVRVQSTNLLGLPQSQKQLKQIKGSVSTENYQQDLKAKKNGYYPQDTEKGQFDIM